MASADTFSTQEVLYIIGAVAVGTISLAGGLFGIWNSMRKEFWRGIEKVMRWQHTHDRKDDKRFSIVDQQLHEISVRNSVRDGTRLKPHRPINDIVDEEIVDEEDD